ncbi:MAG TPA: MgtC/SapB family protein [Bauldia sp.]|nr:MgtC/SapB family protein [Bauldia sp.]
MPATVTAWDILVRLLAAVAIGLALGIDRSEHGSAAGMRTNALVGLAAAAAMVVANLLLATNGKPADSYAVADVLRLPLGVLSGMGFIGAGAILKRGQNVQGLTTAATLWFTTVAGTCVGGGFYFAGLAATVLGLLLLTAMKVLETRLPRWHRARLAIVAEPGHLPSPDLIAALDRHATFVVRRVRRAGDPNGGDRADYEMTVRTSGEWQPSSEFLNAVARLPAVRTVMWRNV